jgi:uncharacterized protein (UPF0303 family)
LDLESDLARLAEQERVLQLRAFDLAGAWELGTRLRAAAQARGVAVAIEIRLLRELVFFCAMPGTTPENADWVRRKRNTVELLQRSSYAVGRSLQRDGTTLEQKMGLASRDYAAHGGSFPVRVAGVGCVGVVTVSGIPQREDHELVTAALAEMCGVAADSVRLDAV